MDENSFCDASEAPDSDETKRSEDWLRQIEKIFLQPSFRAPPTPKQIKIAILDTGIDPTHTRFAGRIGPAKFIREVVEFKDGKPISKAGDDTAGHGTHTAALLARLAPISLIYVARVSNSARHVDSANVAAVRTHRIFSKLQNPANRCRLFNTPLSNGMSTLSQCPLAFPTIKAISKTQLKRLVGGVS